MATTCARRGLSRSPLVASGTLLLAKRERWPTARPQPPPPPQFSTLIFASRITGPHLSISDLQERGELFRRGASRGGAEVVEAGFDGGMRQRGVGVGVEFGDDLRRRLHRQEEAEPARDVEAGHARFRDRRDIGHQRNALLGRHRERAHGAGPAHGR